MARSAIRRAAQTAGAVAIAAVAAGLRHGTLPLAEVRAPRTLGIAGGDSPLAAASALWRVPAAHPSLALAALALAAAAAALPVARRFGRWGAAAAGAWLVAAPLLLAPAVPAAPIVATAWLSAAALALLAERAH